MNCLVEFPSYMVSVSFSGLNVNLSLIAVLLLISVISISVLKTIISFWAYTNSFDMKLINIYCKWIYLYLMQLQDFQEFGNMDCI